MSKFSNRLIEDWDTSKVIWSANPQLKLRFKKLWSNDNSVGKKESSKKLWTVALLSDKSSLFIDEEDKISLVESEFAGKGYYDKHEKEIDELCEKWKEYSWTPAYYSLRKFYDILKKRDKFLDEQEYSFGEFDPTINKIVGNTAVELDKMLANTDKLWATYFKILEESERIEEAGESYGGTEDSASDTGMI